MNTFKAPQTNRKIIIIAVAVTIMVGAGILSYRSRLEKDGKGMAEINALEEVEIESIKKIAEYIKPFLHKEAILRGVEMSPEAKYQGISVEEAVLFAIQHLEAKGAKEIEICETHWIVAPLGAFFIDGKGDLYIGEKHYTTFRVGVRDGSEGRAGNMFVFIARGKDDEGHVIWYPEPGPGFRPAKGEAFPEELFDYEFLGDRKNFESLEARFK
ncbi:MAG: hypothetical protein AMJ94_13755 [Deltaproteobacteria bacterium SM23_61]|nr:MAG: hypothetical protein AMJ94_13755 [Deltaproteobacteria bacterium SM23_61]